MATGQEAEPGSPGRGRAPKPAGARAGGASQAAPLRDSPPLEGLSGGGGDPRGPRGAWLPGRVPSARRLRRWISLALLSAAAVGCGREATPGLIPDSVYIRVMARLVYVREAAEFEGRPPREIGAAVDSALRALLAEHGLTMEDLREYAMQHGDDPRYMERIWEQIADTVDTLEAYRGGRR